MSTMDWQWIITKAFHGNQRIRAGRPRVIRVVDVANNVPDPCKVGMLILDTDANGVPQDAYICTVANTTVVKINA